MVMPSPRTRKRESRRHPRRRRLARELAQASAASGCKFPKSDARTRRFELGPPRPTPPCSRLIFDNSASNCFLLILQSRLFGAQSARSSFPALRFFPQTSQFDLNIRLHRCRASVTSALSRASLRPSPILISHFDHSAPGFWHRAISACLNIFVLLVEHFAERFDPQSR